MSVPSSAPSSDAGHAGRSGPRAVDAGAFGPRVEPGGVRFRLWAPEAAAVALVLDGEVGARRPMQPAGDGRFEVFVAGIGPGTVYAFDVDGKVVADPASRRQANRLDGPSVVVDPAIFARSRRLGRRWEEAVIVEVHVGTATEAGTFRALIDRLDHYVETGFSAIQLMPVADFPGRWSWGYDGVLPFAPARAYGTPEDLVALVEAAHARGLSILLDVVYNHFGPEGAVMHAVAPRFFADGSHTPWGPAIDLRLAPVRRYFVDNALMWVEDYGFDGLRFDAVHAFLDGARAGFLAELAAALCALDPPPHLVAENEHNDADLLARDGAGRPLRFDAQWNDDLHNALHVVLTGETEGYYRAFADDPVGRFARALAEGFCFQGEAPAHRPGRRRGQPSAHLPPSAFVAFVQNHDQIGNRPLGDPLTRTLDADRLALARLVLLLSPQVPMMFMGEEWASRRPFPFFCDFTGDLAEAVRKGRREEFKDFPGFAGEIPDPLDPATVVSARRDFDARGEPPHAAALADTRRLIALRRRHVVPLAATGFVAAESVRHERLVSVRWRFSGGVLVLAMNLGADAALLPHPASPAGSDALFASSGSVATGKDGVALGAWSACAWIEP